MKTCTTCQSEKPLAEFYQKAKGGHQSDCKVCRRASVKAYNAANRDSVRARKRAAYQLNKDRWNKPLTEDQRFHRSIYKMLLRESDVNGSYAQRRIRRKFPAFMNTPLPKEILDAAVAVLAVKRQIWRKMK